jgi:hypothetical protein
MSELVSAGVLGMRSEDEAPMHRSLSLGVHVFCCFVEMDKVSERLLPLFV